MPVPVDVIWWCCQCENLCNKALAVRCVHCSHDLCLSCKLQEMRPLPETHLVRHQKYDHSTLSQVFDGPSTEPSTTSKPLMQYIEEVVRQSLINRDEFEVEDAYAVILVDWKLSDFLNNQYENEDSRQIAQVIALVGAGRQVQATTCEAYIKYNWPTMGTLVLEAMQEALVDSKVTLHCKKNIPLIIVNFFRTSFDYDEGIS